MELGDNVEFGGFVVSRVWLVQKKGGANFNAHAKWAKEGEGERTVLLGNLSKDKKHDEAAIRAMLERAAEEENKKRTGQGEEEEKDDDDGPPIGDKEKQSGRCVVLIVERGG